MDKKAATGRPRARHEKAARRDTKRQSESATLTPGSKTPAPAPETQNLAPGAPGTSRKTQETRAAEKAAFDNSFPNFAKFQKPPREGYKYLKHDYSLKHGSAAGPSRVGFSEGCLSGMSYYAPVPYPQPFRTMDLERWDLNEKWSIKHAMSLGQMEPPIDHGLIRYGQTRGE